MTTGSDDALDVALGLLRAPALRGALRARSLPDGMSELLAIASGSTERARAASLRTGHEPGELLEASRFYVQQVLLAGDADAYRVLGVERGADHAVIRDHHRLLLRWLHPDRNEGAQWDSAFATRVNAAWTQLRSNEAVAEYDAQLDAAAGQGAVPAASRGLRAGPRGMRMERDAPTSRAGPFAVAALGLACIALAWLAVQREGELDRLRDTATDMATRVTADALPPPPPPPAADSARTLRNLPVDNHAPTMPTAVETTSVQSVAARRSTPAPTAAEPTAPRAVRRAETAMQDTSTISIAHAAASSRIAAPEASTPAPPSYSESPISTPTDPLQLMREAEAAVAALTAYLTRNDAPAPAFLDPAVRLQAAGVRSRLHARLDARQRRSMEIEAPAWTLDDRRAALLGAYRIQAARGTRETGLLRLQLARDGDAWRVSELQLEPAR